MLHDPSLSYPLFSCSLGCVSKIQVNKILILRVQTWGPQITSILWIFSGTTKQTTRFCKTFSSWEFWNWELHIAFSGWKSTSPTICRWKNGKCFTVAELLGTFLDYAAKLCQDHTFLMLHTCSLRPINHTLDTCWLFTPRWHRRVADFKQVNIKISMEHHLSTMLSGNISIFNT